MFGLKTIKNALLFELFRIVFEVALSNGNILKVSLPSFGIFSNKWLFDVSFPLFSLAFSRNYSGRVSLGDLISLLSLIPSRPNFNISFILIKLCHASEDLAADWIL